MIIKKSELATLLDGLMKEYRVYAPVDQDGEIAFAVISDGSQAKMGATPKKPPKEILFPQTEELFKYSQTEDGIRMEKELDEIKSVAFGIRPCDAKSFTLLDNVFDNDQFQDVYYLKRRNNTVVVSLGCNNPLSTCFCTSLGGGPFDTTGSDVLLTDVGDAYVAEAVTEIGKEFLAKLNLSEATAEAKEAAAKLKAETKSSETVDVTGVKEKLDTMFDSAFWDKLHEKCIGCGACSYLCPTCHCFDINDEAKDCDGCRVRNWDSCMFPLFTLHGSGHNPRTSGKERWRQRLMHKFNYFVDRYNAVACVGCGRCIINCPVSMDIRQVLADVKAQDSGSEVK